MSSVKFRNHIKPLKVNSPKALALKVLALKVLASKTPSFKTLSLLVVCLNSTWVINAHGTSSQPLSSVQLALASKQPDTPEGPFDTSTLIDAIIHDGFTPSDYFLPNLYQPFQSASNQTLSPSFSSSYTYDQQPYPSQQHPLQHYQGPFNITASGTLSRDISQGIAGNLIQDITWNIHLSFSSNNVNYLSQTDAFSNGGAVQEEMHIRADFLKPLYFGNLFPGKTQQFGNTSVKIDLAFGIEYHKRTLSTHMARTIFDSRLTKGDALALSSSQIEDIQNYSNGMISTFQTPNIALENQLDQRTLGLYLGLNAHLSNRLSISGKLHYQALQDSYGFRGQSFKSYANAPYENASASSLSPGNNSIQPFDTDQRRARQHLSLSTHFAFTTDIAIHATADIGQLELPTNQLRSHYPNKHFPAQSYSNQSYSNQSYSNQSYPAIKRASQFTLGLIFSPGESSYITLNYSSINVDKPNANAEIQAELTEIFDLNTSKLGLPDYNALSSKQVLTLSYRGDMFSGLVRLNRYDEQASIEQISSAALNNDMLVDIEGRFTFSETYTVTLGGENIFDFQTDRTETHLPQIQGNEATPFGNKRGFWYLRGTANF
ncbi:MAG: hypothetical protein KUG79_06605 [Pseudomonadales bacterium]|nr:hypothetical protein [Pseudomonadales bacterium]